MDDGVLGVGVGGGDLLRAEGDQVVDALVHQEPHLLSLAVEVLSCCFYCFSCCNCCLLCCLSAHLVPALRPAHAAELVRDDPGEVDGRVVAGPLGGRGGDGALGLEGRVGPAARRARGRRAPALRALGGVQPSPAFCPQ